ncbi:branched-chain amino acid ABC transporter permease [Nocardioides acrostichi]|uniref:Branched-chain amino acid ABC transporter permease n=1 Tax=Nocardioides acrostichi TaxID=2784339 RepID=A0A930V125_9ACTN|nr:branched-chain amino acid ABC transporter permease [Nocardioides acrostichi]MBF4162730.1 branched-chain amino acid ABC transporter permease [Nocardioides acrostichi]
MDLLVARLIDGLNNGVIYGFLALALVCVYRSTKHLNLAQGEMAMFCAFIAYAATQAGVPVVFAIVIAIAAGVIMGGVVERVLVRPLGHDADYSILLVTIGLFLALNATAGIIWGGEPLAFPTVFSSGAEDYIGVLGSRVRYQQLLLAVLLAAVLAAILALFKYTKLGLAMRTATSNPESAALLGIRVNRINALGWMMAAAVGGLLGPLVAPGTTLTTYMMFTFLIYAAAAATLGGFDSPGGAVLAGLIIGVLESLIGGYVSFVGSDLKLAVALVLLLIVLMVRPSGLFGSRRVERV